MALESPSTSQRLSSTHSAWVDGSSYDGLNIHMTNLSNSMPPPLRYPSPKLPEIQALKPVQFGSVPKKQGHRVMMYGAGGIGKTTLTCQAPGKSAMVDLDESLSKLTRQFSEQGIETPAIVPAVNWTEVRTALQAPGWEKINNIIIDSGSRLEESCVAHTLRTIKNDKDKLVNGIEGYGFGKGYQYVFEQWLKLIGDLDAHVRAGRNVFIICHDCTSNVPNPNGEDWIRYEPRLQNSKSASIRLKMKEWCDHVLFIGYDVTVKKGEGKAEGCGSRTMYTAELPHCMAKSRSTQDQIVIGQENPWEKIIV